MIWIDVRDWTPEIFTKVLANVRCANEDIQMTAFIDENDLWHLGTYDCKTEGVSAALKNSELVTHWTLRPKGPRRRKC